MSGCCTTSPSSKAAMATYQALSHADAPNLVLPTAGKHVSLTIVVEPGDDQILIQQFPSPNTDTMKELRVPPHPIPCMQGAFAESMLEASRANSPTFPKPDNHDAATRRQILLDQGIAEETHAARWKQKPGQRFHELWKLMSQISFGIYLLLNGIAKDDEQVLNILQGHVDEVDAFLEMTLDDFDLARRDIEERLKFLKMPLDNIYIFDAMLEDRNFRLQIVTGNERIEHIITRTAAAMNDSLKDVQQGLDATKQFAIYLAEEQDTANWRVQRPEMQKVYEAMKGNAEGWYKAYVSLQTNGSHLGVALVQLGSIVAEMDKRAGEFSIAPGPPGSPPASPVTSTPSSPPSSSRRHSSSHHTKPSTGHASQASVSSVTKNLPRDPELITPAIRATLPVFQYVSERERTPEPDSQNDPESEVELDPEPKPIITEATLQPRTYTPVPQRPPTPELGPRGPETRQKSSLRQRFSLKKKAPLERKTPPIPTPLQSPQSLQSPRSHTLQSPRSNISLRSRPPTNSSQRPVLEQYRSTPSPSYGHGPDSAYYSDENHTKNQGRSSSQTPRYPAHSQNHSPGYVASPRSDQQHFHPVRANPNSPLQRPWTAGPTNLRTYSASTTNLSMMTTVVENGVKVKKKRSTFGWLKNAFALSADEKAEFERKRRGQATSSYAPERRPQPRFLDGKRIR